MALMVKIGKAVNIFITLLFILGFIGGNVLRISLGNGVAIGLYDVVIGIIVVLLGLRLSLVTSPERSRRTRLSLSSSIGIFFLICIISLILNSHRFTFSELLLSSLYLVRLLLYASFYFVVFRGMDSGRMWLKRIWIALVGIAVIGFLQYALYPDLRNLYYLGWDPHYYRIVSTILDPNFAGILFVLGVFLSFYLYKKESRKIFLAGGYIIFFALLFTYSRASYVSFFSGLIIWFFRKNRLHLLGGIVLGSLALILFLPRPGGEGVKLERRASIGARVGNMREAITVIRSSPVYGVGFNTLRYLKGAESSTGIVSHAASGFDMSILFILSTTGFVGLIAYGNILYSIFLSIRNKYKKCSDLTRLIVVSLFAIGVHGLSVNTYFYSLVLIYLAVLMGVYERDDE